MFVLQVDGPFFVAKFLALPIMTAVTFGRKSRLVLVSLYIGASRSVQICIWTMDSSRPIRFEAFTRQLSPKAQDCKASLPYSNF